MSAIYSESMEAPYSTVAMEVAQTEAWMLKMARAYAADEIAAFQISPDITHDHMAGPARLRPLLGKIASAVYSETGWRPTFESQLWPIVPANLAPHTDYPRYWGPAVHHEQSPHGGQVLVARINPELDQNNFGLPLAGRPARTRRLTAMARLAEAGYLNGPVFEGALEMDMLTVFSNSHPATGVVAVHQMVRNRPMADEVRWTSYVSRLAGTGEEDDLPLAPDIYGRMALLMARSSTQYAVMPRQRHDLPHKRRAFTFAKNMLH